jgi:signal transduction histidine kinase
MNLLRPTTLRWTLTELMMATAVAALLLTCAALIGYQYLTARQDLERELGSLADMIGATSSAAVQFGDTDKAQEILTKALSVDPRLVEGRLETAGGGQLARWRRGASAGGASLGVRRAIVHDREQLGFITLRGDLTSAYARWQDYVMLVGALLAASLWLAFMLSYRFQRVISSPILHLADQSLRVSQERDYSIRVERRSNNEIGILYDRFNEMLEQIEERDRALRDAHDRLEERVAARTRELRQEVAERRRTEAALIVARDVAESASKAKSAFVANMSHELRTPLNAIIGYSEMLHEDAEADGDAVLARDLSRVVVAGKHLLRLISDVLDLSKIEAGRMVIGADDFPVAAVVDEVVQTTRPLAEKNGNQLEVVTPADLGVMTSDRTRVAQILLNVLGNAAKFTERGRIRLTATRRTEARGDLLVFEVADTGIGMDRADLEHLFVEFTQADASASRKYEGTGLGLAISRHFCRLMGGHISVASERGVGSTFTIVLPAAVDAEAARPTGAQHLTPALSASGDQAPMGAREAPVSLAG